MEGSENYKRDLGRLGEDLACRHLETLGHRILARNWRNGHLEIDIISLNKDGIHFVEVKTRRESIQAPPQESVDRKKQMRITKAAAAFLKSGKGQAFGGRECLFDIVAVTFIEDQVRIEYFPQAYIPIYL
jgi:putative endonuclease